jgi:choline dehydrogenase-like flavoprotein
VTEHYDVIIVGSGAGGGTLAHTLAPSGQRIGTCRFGADPATSVLDVNCKAHELDNLYVVDTSFFPSIGAVNPALTAMANAIRVGENLLGRMS